MNNKFRLKKQKKPTKFAKNYHHHYHYHYLTYGYTRQELLKRNKTIKDKKE